MRLALQFGTAVPTARMTHTILNLHWCGTPTQKLALKFRLEKQTWHSISKLTHKLALHFKNDVAP